MKGILRDGSYPMAGHIHAEEGFRGIMIGDTNEKQIVLAPIPQIGYPHKLF
jgi:hypothetical protein